MSNTVITNYTDLNGPSAKADSSVVVIVNKDGTLSVDQNLLDTLMGTDGTQSAISVVRVGHEGKPDDATDSENEDENIPHVTLSVDSYYDEPNSIIKYDSGAEMLQSLRIETRENSLVGFQNDHCYTPLMAPSPTLPQGKETLKSFNEPVLEVTHTLPPKPVPNTKKITIIEQQIIPKGKKIVINTPTESPIILKNNDILNKPLPVVPKVKEMKKSTKAERLQKDESSESSSLSSSDESVADRDSDSDYKETRDRAGPVKVRKSKVKPRILKSKPQKQEVKPPKQKVVKVMKPELKEKPQQTHVIEQKDSELDLETILPSSRIPSSMSSNATNDLNKNVVKVTPKPVKKEKKTPAHVTALLSDMTSLFSTPDVIRRVSVDNKAPVKADKETANDKKIPTTPKGADNSEVPAKIENAKVENIEKARLPAAKTYSKAKEKLLAGTDKTAKPFDHIPQLDDASLAQILQDPTGITPVKTQQHIPTASVINSPGLAGPLSPTLDLLGGLQPEEEGLTEDLLMHVAQLVESSENLQEVIDKQVLGEVDTVTPKVVPQTPFQQAHSSTNLYMQTLSKAVQKTPVRKDGIEIVRKDGRVITLPPIEAPATRSSKRKSQIETTTTEALGAMLSTPPSQPTPVSPEPQVQAVSKQYTNKKAANKKLENVTQSIQPEKLSAESQESWNSEDDPNRLWCICKQPHNNRFMICCDGCEDWFHGKCVNITKAMGQQMEEQGIEWRCPNCIKKAKPQPKTPNIKTMIQKKIDKVMSATNTTPAMSQTPTLPKESTKTSCIVCKKSARASSIYCSDACILKHAQDSLETPSGTKPEDQSGKTQDKQKSDSRVIVYERKSGRLLAGPNAPTAENLKSWLQKNPTFEVVRPGTLSTIKPNTSKKKVSNEPNKVQTTLNFERIPRKAAEQNLLVRTQQPEVKEKINKLMTSREETKQGTPKSAATHKASILGKSAVTPKNVTPKSLNKQNTTQLIDSPKPSTSSAKPMSEPRKPAKSNVAANRSLSLDKTPSVSPSPSRKKETHFKRMDSSDPIRDNVRKSLHEQMSVRMAETTGSKFTEQEIQQLAVDTEAELHDLFRDVGIKYKAKYRSLMFNIKDRKNLTLWQKICERSITPHQLVRLSPEELASQELAEWRDQEAKHQLELIKKSELDLLAASKTYVLKTHKGEEVMENKESVSTELDPNVPVEDVVIALNDSTVGEEVTKEVLPDTSTSKSESTDKKNTSRKRGKEGSDSGQPKKGKKDSDARKRSSRRKSGSREKEPKEESRRSTRTAEKKSLRSEDKAKSESKSDTVESSRRESRDKSKRSRNRSRSRSKARSHSSSRSRRRSRSQSRDSAKRRSRSKYSSSTDEKGKHRSKSQDNAYNKKNDSTDSDSLERPKSAMLKEAHPEYDPHEPMITSAFSEEDLRKSREDVSEGFKHDGDTALEYDPSKGFSIDTESIMSSSTYIPNLPKQDKSSEAESDQEPSSTVENAAATVWNGCINMVDVARFYVAAHEVSGSATDLEEDLPTELDIVGRINPDTVWDYIGKMKKASNKDIVILRLQAANDEEKMQYIALYSYLSSRNRLGVVKVSNTTTVKDFYILPLAANSTLPPVLLPLEGPGGVDAKTHLLLAIVIRQRKKRLAPHVSKDIIPAKIARESKYVVSSPGVKASYTPPMSPRRRAPHSFTSYTSPALSTSVKDKIAASLAAADDDEAYSPGSTDSSGSGGGGALPAGLASRTLQTKVEELNRQIEEQKQQILKMAQADSSLGEDEAYSPSRPMTPPLAVDKVPLAEIALPSNLQEILATIKQRSETASVGDVDMRI